MSVTTNLFLCNMWFLVQPAQQEAIIRLIRH